jgi:hypothetical protein
MLNLIKGFIPIWRFFESGEVIPQIWIQTKGSPHWQKWIQPQANSFFRIFHNPNTNFELYKYSLCSEVARDILENKLNSEAQKHLRELLSPTVTALKIVNLKDQSTIAEIQVGSSD